MVANNKYGGLTFEGQRNHVSFNLEAAVENGDVVTATATDGALGRGSSGDEIVGVVMRKENDNVGGVKLVGTNEIITLPRTGAITSGVQALAVAGDGTVIAGTGTRTFMVIGTQTVETVDYVTFVL
ncbi:MAG: hypothetical protein AAF267_20190 [Deinococcota bacterium]